MEKSLLLVLKGIMLRYTNFEVTLFVELEHEIYQM